MSYVLRRRRGLGDIWSDIATTDAGEVAYAIAHPEIAASARTLRAAAASYANADVPMCDPGGDHTNCRLIPALPNTPPAGWDANTWNIVLHGAPGVLTGPAAPYNASDPTAVYPAPSWGNAPPVMPPAAGALPPASNTASRPQSSSNQTAGYFLNSGGGAVQSVSPGTTVFGLPVWAIAAGVGAFLFLRH